MITVVGKVILNPEDTKFVAITGFTFKNNRNSLSTEKQVGSWIFENFQEEFEEMGLLISKIEYMPTS